jgi:hypothetical protein
MVRIPSRRLAWADVSFFGSNGAQFYELGLGFTGDNARQGGLAAARWPPEYQAGGLLTFYDLVDNLAMLQQMLLANDLIQAFGAHSFGKGLMLHSHSIIPAVYNR